MCFKISEEGKTKKRKICYKILQVNKDGTINSPYYMKSWKINKEQKVKLIKRPSRDTNYVYSANGLYTYENRLTAIRELRVFGKKTKPKFYLFKCIISKDSKYFSGQGQICSEKLIIKRKLIFNLI